jgi:hypothetical protein
MDPSQRERGHEISHDIADQIIETQKATIRELVEASRVFLTSVRITHPVPYEDWADEAVRLEVAIEMVDKTT